MSSVIIVGDSWSATQPGKSCWANQVAAQLSNVEFTNISYGGTGWQHWSPSGWNYVNQLVPQLRTSLVCITCGANDLGEVPPWVAAAQMREFVQELWTDHLTLVMVSMYGTLSTVVSQYNDHLRNLFEAAKGFDGELLLDDPSHYDGEHPSQLGHNRIAAVMAQRIRDVI